MKKFLFFSLLMCCASLNACSEPELNSMLKHQNWEPLIPIIRKAFKKKDTQTLGWIQKVNVSPYVPLIYESMRDAVNRALTEKELQKHLSLTIIALAMTIIDLLSCEKLKYMNTQEQKQTYKRIKENFRHRLYYKAPILQQFWEEKTPYKDLELQYSQIIIKAKKSYETLLEKKITLPNPIWVTKVANTSFLKLKYWIDFGTPPSSTYENSQDPKSLVTINETRMQNTNILWDFFLTISDWKHFFALTWKDIITNINSKKNDTLWLSLMIEENTSSITIN